MSAEIIVLPVVAVAREPSATVFTIRMSADRADLIRQCAHDWGCSPEQYLADLIDEFICFGRKV